MPAAKRGGSDEEARDGEKDLHSTLSIPEEEGELIWDMRVVGNVGEKQTHVDVVHQYEKDG
jgi:hypothetical protein